MIDLLCHFQNEKCEWNITLTYKSNERNVERAGILIYERIKSRSLNSQRRRVSLEKMRSVTHTYKPIYTKIYMKLKYFCHWQEHKLWIDSIYNVSSCYRCINCNRSISIRAKDSNNGRIHKVKVFFALIQAWYFSSHFGDKNFFKKKSCSVWIDVENSMSTNLFSR